MKAEHVVRYFEDYYGEYRPAAKVALLTWLNERNEVFWRGLIARVTSTYSNVYGRPPDKAKCMEYVCQETYDAGREQMTVEAEKRKALPTSDKKELA